MKFIIPLILSCIVCLTTYAQSRPYTDGFNPRSNQSTVAEDGYLSARNSFFIPRYDDTTQANTYILKDTLGSIIYTYDVQGYWLRVIFSGGKQWMRYTAFQGLTLNEMTFEWMGDTTSPAQITKYRSLNMNRNILMFANSENITTQPIVNFGNQVTYSPYQYYSRDTITINAHPLNTPGMPWSGIYAKRDVVYADGILKFQKYFGHELRMDVDWKDSVVFYTEGGDYNTGAVIERRLRPRGTGRQATGIHGTGSHNLPYYGVPVLLVNYVTENNGSNYVYQNGWSIGVNSYMVSSAGDTSAAHSFYQTGSGFIGGHVNKLFGMDFEHPLSTSVVDSSWGVFDKWGYRHWLRGKTVIGEAFDSSVTGYNLKVNGAMYMRGLFQGFQGTDVASTAGVMTLPGSATAGNIYEITGTNTITAINNTNLKNGYEVTFVFTSTATLTDGTANSGAAIGIELAGNTNFTASAGDAVTLILAEIGGTQRWREKCRSEN